MKKSFSDLNPGFLVDSGLTWVDLFVADHLGTLTGFEPHALDGHKELQHLREKVLAVPEIKEWVAKRPATQM